MSLRLHYIYRHWLHRRHMQGDICRTRHRVICFRTQGVQAAVITVYWHRLHGDHIDLCLRRLLQKVWAWETWLQFHRPIRSSSTSTPKLAKPAWPRYLKSPVLPSVPKYPRQPQPRQPRRPNWSPRATFPSRAHKKPLPLSVSSGYALGYL